jgi:integrase-like protein
VDRHGRVLARRLTEQTVYDRLRHLAQRAGVAAFSPHDCRRSLAGDLLDAGVDLSTVQVVLGHASPATAARYDRRGEREIRYPSLDANDAAFLPRNDNRRPHLLQICVSTFRVGSNPIERKREQFVLLAYYLRP